MILRILSVFSVLLLVSGPAWAISSAPELNPASMASGVGLAAATLLLLLDGRRGKR